jgi:RNA polymerase sigma-70 factor (ECF subfamily)
MTLSAEPAFAGELEMYRRELTGYCYRMLGSGFEAEDAVQETLLRAWRNVESFERRSSLRTWLYRIATNVCMDMLRSAQRRTRPANLGPDSLPLEIFLGPMLPGVSWVTPILDSRIAPYSQDPAERTLQRESVRLAFIAALQYLPSRQRAVLILCEVLSWRADEVAELLDTSVPAVNSALQRARETLRSRSSQIRATPLDEVDVGLLERYVDAFERYDIDRLVALLRDDAVQSMPPFAMWVRGAADIGKWMVQPSALGCRGSRLLPVSINGCPAFGQYRPDPSGGYMPWALQILEIEDGKVVELNYFLTALDPEGLFPRFGLPNHLDEMARDDTHLRKQNEFCGAQLVHGGGRA